MLKPLVFNLKPSSFWFYLSSMYFPKCSNEIVEDFEKVPESIRLLLEKIIDSKGQIKKLKHDPYHKKIVSDILSVVGECNQPNTPIDVMIEQMTKLLENVIGRNDKTLTDLKGDIIKRPLMTDRDDYYTYRSDNILTDLEYDSVWPVKFTKHLIKKNEERQNLSTTYEVPEDPDDVVCQVCNDGDYEDYDLIVYCSSCTLTVHQSCYGIVTIPEGDWLCNVCNLSDTERVECVLCPVKGGAMKPCSLRKTSNLYTTIMNLRKESSHLVRFELQQNHKKTIENNLSESLSNNSESSKTNKQTAKTSPNKIKSNPSIDLNNKNKINGLNEIINKENAWVHLSCALWIPEVIINDFASKEEIRSKTTYFKRD